MKKILVTGSSGLIGSEVSTYFASKGWQVNGVDNNQRAIFFGPQGDTRWNQERLIRELNGFKHWEVDIRDREGIRNLVASIKPDAIVHTAAQPSHDRAASIPFEDFDTNAVGTFNLFESLRRYSTEVPFVHLSTNHFYIVRSIAINFIRAHMHKGRLGTGLAGGFEKVKRPNSIRIEIVERNRGGAIVRGLGGGVDDYGWAHRFNEGEDASAVADIQFVVNKTLQLGGESALIPARVALGPEKSSALVVVHPVNRAALTGKKQGDLGTDQAGGASDECFHIDPETKWAGPKVKKIKCDKVEGVPITRRGVSAWRAI